MKALLLFFVLIMNSTYCQQTTAYQPPVFADADRLSKIAATKTAIEKLYHQHATERHFPGMAFGVVADGKLIYSGGFGYADLAKKIPATPHSVFRIASMTKSFTAMAILKLRDEGKLRLDDPASLYIPALKKMALLTKDAPPITVRNLMAHATGLPEDNPWGDRQLADTEAELTQLIEAGFSFANVPGVAYEYSNLAFAMLGRIITVVSGRPYQRYISQEITEPLGMAHTYWEYANVPPNLLAHGYRRQNEQFLEETPLHDGSHGAMGGLLTTIDDFAKYAALHLSAWPPRNDTDTAPLKRSSLREMHQPATFSGLSPSFKFPNNKTTALTSSYAYGLSWSADGDGRTYVGHSGGLPGFGSQWRMMPQYGIAVVAFSNLTYGGLGAVNWAALDSIVALAELKPRQLPASKILNERKDQLIKLLPDWKNASDARIFAENFFLDYSQADLQQAFQQLYGKIGNIKYTTELVPENQLRGSFRIVGEKGNLEIFFTLTPESKPLIQQLDVSEIPKQ